jgi:DNA-binding NarL/FixJ family response regulator
VQEAEQRIETLRPDVLLVDLNLGRADGMELLHYVRDRWVGMKTVVVTQHAPAFYADEALEAGAMGFVCKDEAAEHVVEAVRAANRGDSYLSPRAHEVQ